MRQVQMAVLLGTALLAGSSFARTVDVPEGTTETLSDSLSGGEELVKTGLGTLVLGGANTGWTGAIDVQGGVLESPYDSLGTTGDMRVRSGATLRVTGQVRYTRQTRHLYVSGTGAADAGGAVVAAVETTNNDWLLADVTLEGDTTFGGGAMGFTDGTLDFGGYTLTLMSGTGVVWFSREQFARPGKIAKTNGYIGLYGYTSDYGEGVTIEVFGNVTVEMHTCRGCKALFRLVTHEGARYNWLAAKATSNPDTDNIWAGPIEIVGSSNQLMLWADNAAIDNFVVEGPISGAGYLSSGNGETQAAACFTLRGDAANTFRNGLVANAASWRIEGAHKVPTERDASSRAYLTYGNGNITLVGWTDEEAGALLASTALNGGTGRVVLDPGTNGVMEYHGPFNSVLAHDGAGVIATTTNAITSALLAGVRNANLSGDWRIVGDPSATAVLGDTYYKGGRMVLRDAGTVSWNGNHWMVAQLQTTENVDAPRLRFEGATTVLASEGSADGWLGLFAGYGGDNGLGVIEVADGATITSRWQVAHSANERGAVYQTGGQAVAHSTGKSVCAGGRSGDGGWFLRGGEFVVDGYLLCARAADSYFAFVQHGGTARITTSGQVRFGAGGRSQVLVDGGEFIDENTDAKRYAFGFNVNENVGGITHPFAESGFTVSGSNAVVRSRARLENWMKNSVTRYTVRDGGTLEAPVIGCWLTGGYAPSSAYVAFDGGIWKVGETRKSGNLFHYSDDDNSIAPTSVVIYEGGLVLDTSDGTFRTRHGFERPTGLGVRSVTLPDEIGGVALADWKYVTCAKLWLEGGNGSANALVDFDERTGETKGVLVTSSGYGYSEAPTAYVVSANGLFTNTCAVTMFEPKGGGFTKKGTGTFIFDCVNTYAGPTVVAEGTLEFKVAGSVPEGADVTVQTNATAQFDAAATLAALRGAGTVKGDVTVTNALVCAYADVSAGRHLSVQGALAASAGAKLTISDPEALLEGRKGGAVLTATGGISGTFTLDTGDVDAGNLWRLVQRDANTLALSSARGTVVVFR